LDLFADANAMTMGFKEGSEPPWAINMRGSRETVDSFAKCVIALGQTPGTTQPFGSSKPSATPANPSQPFGGSKPATTTPRPRDNGGI
jgi:hypothetical protein